MMRSLDAFLDILSRIYLRLSQALLVALVAGVFWQVISRYAFSKSIIGLDELTKFALVWITFMMAVVLHRRNRHISITILTDAASDSFRRTGKIITGVATMALCVFVYIQLWNVWGFLGLVSPVFEIPDYAYRIAPLFAFGPIFLQECVNLARNAGRAAPDGAARD
ncbi:TRAP transporter small permease subunit [Hoeflea sp. CAU 1731]